MTLEQRDRLRRWLALCAVVAAGLSLLIRLRLAPMAQRLVLTQVDNQASDAINEAIAQQVAEGGFSYDRMITLEKDAAGRITAIRTNVGELNRLKTGVLQQVDARLNSLSMEQLSVPVGSILLPELFSGHGPAYPVQVLAVRTSDANFRNSFSSAGINQTLHTIYIDINVTITVLTWSGTCDVAVETAVVAAETVIVGAVPESYFGMEELP